MEIETTQYVPESGTVGLFEKTLAVNQDLGAEFSGVLQLEGYPHIVALLGIVALVVLGGALHVRKRLETQPTDSVSQTANDEEGFATDREQVHRLISNNGGRMKQTEIVESVDWSKAKVSRLLADLEAEGEITKLRIGRENLICIRGNEPALSKSQDSAESE